MKKRGERAGLATKVASVGVAVMLLGAMFGFLASAASAIPEDGNCTDPKPTAPHSLRSDSSNPRLLTWSSQRNVDGFNVHKARDGSFVASVGRNAFKRAVPGESYFVTAYCDGAISDRSPTHRMPSIWDYQGKKIIKTCLSAEC